MDTLQWPQEIVVKTIEESSCPKASLGSGGKISSRNTQKEEEEGKKYCPRCNSTNTKFCYYNNYSLTQPRYFCKTCRRYWTQGGSLRNIPVGGGSRKNKRSSSSSSSSSSSNSKSLPNLVTHDPASNSSSNSTNQIPSNPNHDLNLPFPPNPSSCGGIRSFSDLIQLDTHKSFRVPFSTSVSSELVAAADNCSLPVSALELLTGISTTTRGSNNSSFMPIYNTAGFDPLGDLKPISLNFSLDGINGSNINEENTSGRFLFPFEDLKQVSANNDNRENEITEKGDSAEYWSGMLGGGNGSW